MELQNITQQYLRLFPGDMKADPRQRQTPGLVFTLTETAGFPGAQLLHFNSLLAAEIGLNNIEKQEDIDFLNSNVEHLENIRSYATAYAGHQFGSWAGQLGDGRAIFAGEIRNRAGKTTELQWKGAGATPYSRHADGRAVLRSTVREYLMGEAMHCLGVPTSRSLSLSLTGEEVVRDIMYSGHPKPEKGALMMRTAESFLRFGHFEALSATKSLDTLRSLADFTIASYYPDISGQGRDKYLSWFRLISERTADVMVEWYRVGFVHGVMNTDNMSALGLTIDYGPFSMLEAYSLAFTPNTTDLPGRRYAFGEQAKIAQWNLWQLANALFPLIQDAEALQDILNDFGEDFWQKHDQMLCRKFGLDGLRESDEAFFTRWQVLMQELEADYTLFFQKLENPEHFDRSDLEDVCYRSLGDAEFSKFENFLGEYRHRLSINTINSEESLRLMRVNNPKFILRNYLLFECIEELNAGNSTLFNKIWEALQKPYEILYPEFNVKRPSKYDQVAGCSMLSCSS